MSQSIARLIDHSLLHPTLTVADLRSGCELARRLEVASVCIKPYAVPLAVEMLIGSPVRVGTVVGFPHGSHATSVKIFETEKACRDGAHELDMVVNIGQVLSGDWANVEAEIRSVVEVAKQFDALTKVIFENDFLTADDQKIRLCQISERAGADFVKTSTGFAFCKLPGGHYGYRGATETDVRLMRAHVGPRVQVKAAGGIRTCEDARRMCQAGASRLGTTATEAIVVAERQLAKNPSGNR